MKSTTDIGKFYYFFPQAVAVVGIDKNVMPAAWHTPISAEPPLYGVVVSPKRHTFELLQKRNGFTINFLEHDQAHLVAKIGSTSGRDINKLKEFNIKFVPAERVNARYECEKIAASEYGDHFLFIGKIVLIHYKKELMNSRRLLDEKKVSPMLYFGQDRYITIDPQTLSVFKRK